VVLLVLPGCSTSSVTTDAGGVTTDVSTDIGVSSPDASGADAPPACGPLSDVGGYQPQTMMPPNPAHAGVCDAQQASDYALCKGAGNTALCAQFESGQPGQTCRECIETQTTDPQWGVIVFTGSNGVLNIEGCVDDALSEVNEEKADGGTGSCGDLMFALGGCEAYACTGCMGSAHDACLASSISECKAYDDPVESTSGPCAPLLGGDAASLAVQSCFPNPTITNPTSQEVDLVDRMVTFMCGQ